MHQCLEIEELIVLIVSFTEKRDLLSLALTCKRLKEPALRPLWGELHNINYFLKLFPQDAWTLRRRSKRFAIEESIEPTRELGPLDWSRVVPYAHLVRKFVTGYSEPSNRFLASVVRSLDGALLFPGLRQLSWITADMDSNIPFVKAVLSPYLTHLVLQPTRIPSMELLTVISQLGTLCPSIVSFTYHSPVLYSLVHKEDNSDLALREALSHSVIHWDRLKQLNVPILTDGALKYLSNLPTLTNLSLHCKDNRDLVPHPSSLTGFRPLRHLSIYSCKLDFATRILDALKVRSLESMVYEAPEDELGIETRGMWEEFFTVLAQHTTASQQTGLQIRGEFLMRNGPLGIDMLRPLLAAHNLAYLSLPSLYQFDLTDDVIQEIAESSPNLVSLEIGSDSGVPKPLTLTLNAYRHIFVNCPKLIRVGLEINTDTDLVEDLNNKPTHMYGGDLQFFVGGSEVKDPSRLAVFLLPFFYENMGPVFTGEMAPIEVDKGWEDTKLKLAVLIKDRAKSCDKGKEVIGSGDTILN